MKTMKYNITILLLAFFSTIQIKAQDITTIHMKDGSTVSYENGRYSATDIRFWDCSSEQARQLLSKGVFRYQLDKSNNGYSVEIRWYSPFNELIPTNSTTYAVCVGSKEFETKDDCDFVEEGNADATSTIWDYQLGKEYQLQKGIDYYCRIMSRTPYMQGGKECEAYTYSKTAYQFRIPNLMGESGLIPEKLSGADVTYPDTTAWAAFYKKHFPEISSDMLGSLGYLWMMWWTDHQSEVSISKDVKFDDGVLHLVSTIPDAFHSWITSREIVINAVQILNMSECTMTRVSNIDEKWQIPGNAYLLFEPIRATANISITFNASEIVPGIPYSLECVFAPDVKEQNNKPTKLNIQGTDINGVLTTIGESTYDISATEVTRLTISEPVSNLVNLTIQSRVTTRQVSQYSRIIRLAEIRLKPVK